MRYIDYLWRTLSLTLVMFSSTNEAFSVLIKNIFCDLLLQQQHSSVVVPRNAQVIVCLPSKANLCQQIQVSAKEDRTLLVKFAFRRSLGFEASKPR